jgi:hypothetical protein
VNREAELPHVVGTLRSRGRFANLLNRRQKQTNQDGDDRDDDEQLNECECTPNGRREHGNPQMKK